MSPRSLILRMQFPDSIPAEGINIPLKMSFSGIKNLPLLSFTHNSINPKLLIFEDATETRVLRSKRRPIAEIESINVSLVLGTLYLNINWTNRWFDFTGAVEETTLLAVVAFFRRKNVVLGDGAKRFIS